MIGRAGRVSPFRKVWKGTAGICVAVAVCAVAPLASAASVNIAGSYDTDTLVVDSGGNYRPLEINTSVLFDLSQGPVTVTGTVDLNGLWGNSSVYVGLISKERYDAWVAAGHDPNDSNNGFFGFVEEAYGVFNTVNGGRLGLGQYLQTGELTQVYHPTTGVGPVITDFELTFDLTQMTLDYNSITRTRNYVDHRDYPGTVAAGSTQMVPTDWSSGAYAFVGTWFDKTPPDPLVAPIVDLTFTGPGTVVPVPAAAGLMLLGMGGIALRRLRSRKS